MCDAVRELIWFDNIVQDCTMAGIITKEPPLPTLYADNQPAIDFMKSPIENRLVGWMNFYGARSRQNILRQTEAVKFSKVKRERWKVKLQWKKL